MRAFLSHLFKFAVRLIGGRFEYAVQTSYNFDVWPSCVSSAWSTWASGFASFDEAKAQLITEALRLGAKEHVAPMKWRIERRIVWTSYFYPLTVIRHSHPKP
jgi:hypothetical protein